MADSTDFLAGIPIPAGAIPTPRESKLFRIHVAPMPKHVTREYPLPDFLTRTAPVSGSSSLDRLVPRRIAPVSEKNPRRGPSKADLASIRDSLLSTFQQLGAEDAREGRSRPSSMSDIFKRHKSHLEADKEYMGHFIDSFDDFADAYMKEYDAHLSSRRGSGGSSLRSGGSAFGGPSPPIGGSAFGGTPPSSGGSAFGGSGRRWTAPPAHGYRIPPISSLSSSFQILVAKIFSAVHSLEQFGTKKEKFGIYYHEVNTKIAQDEFDFATKSLIEMFLLLKEIEDRYPSKTDLVRKEATQAFTVCEKILRQWRSPMDALKDDL